MSRFVVTGTGRSGTRWCAHLLRAAGVNCGHEQVFTFRVALGRRPHRWREFAADSSWLAVPLLPALRVPAYLVVRHPLKVAHSMLQLGWFAQDQRRDVNGVIYQHLPQVRDEATREDKALAMWLHWNLTALPYAAHVFRLEHLLTTGGADLLTAAGRGPVPPAELEAIAADPARRNTKTDRKRPADPPRWGDFRPELAVAARRVAQMFGYDPD